MNGKIKIGSMWLKWTIIGAIDVNSLQISFASNVYIWTLCVFGCYEIQLSTKPAYWSGIEPVTNGTPAEYDIHSDTHHREDIVMPTQSRAYVRALWCLLLSQGQSWGHCDDYSVSCLLEALWWTLLSHAPSWRHCDAHIAKHHREGIVMLT